MWRIESGKIIARLVRIVRSVDLAEELAHDALVAALERWPEAGVPDNPGAWLMATAKHRAIDLLRKRTLHERKHEELGLPAAPNSPRARSPSLTIPNHQHTRHLPMNVSEALVARRAIKWYDPEHRMPEAEFRHLMELAILAPTAFNIQNWRFVVVRDPALRQADSGGRVGPGAGDRRLAADCAVRGPEGMGEEPARYWATRRSR